jgi:glycosyltransferase involved in cell wall biosynthesis
MVSPRQGFAHWRILDDWIHRAARRHGNAWHNCRMILRLYDVSCIEFNGLNAHRIQDHPLPATDGQMLFDLPNSGTCQLAEVGFVLQSGEFLPAARSLTVTFATGGPSHHGDPAAVLVDESGKIEEVGNLWDQEKILLERRTPKLRTPLRIAACAFASSAPAGDGFPGKFISELAAGLAERGHEVHLFVPACDGFRQSRRTEGVWYEPLDVCLQGTPLEQAREFAQRVIRRWNDFEPFDLIHLHEWMTAWGAWFEGTPTILSLTSTETTRRNGASAGSLSLEIERMEAEIASSVDYVLTPDWLRPAALSQFAIDEARIHAFPMEGRLPNEWECPLDYGQVKGEIGVGPLDRLMLFIGPLEHAAGSDLIIEALPVVLGRWPNVRVALAGSGEQYGHLERRAGELGVGYAVRLLGDVESGRLTRLLRASEALVLPSRYRVPLDDAVVDLARRAGRPVITTHGGPAHLIEHEETGVVTYDNPGSIVWAMDNVLGDSFRAARMGESARSSDGFVLNWRDAARRYVELCAARFPRLTEAGG